MDYETFSEVDITKAGGDVYARDPSTEILMCAYAFDEEPVKLWVPAEGQPIPSDFKSALTDKTVTKFAWNKPFEYQITKHVLGIDVPHNLWRDPMVLAMSCSFPGSLDKVGKIIGIEEDKQKLSRGKALIRKFCVPRKPTKNKPWVRDSLWTERDDWEEFKAYCVNDVEAERAIWHKLKAYDMPRHEWNYWVLDQLINQAGMPINQEYVDAACRIYDEAVTSYLAEMGNITGLDNPNSPKQILPWLQAQGYVFDDLLKGHVSRAIEMCEDTLKEHFDDPQVQKEVGELKTVMELRQKSAAASVKKYYALQRATPREDGNLRNCFQFAGAQRTWRWAGRIFQPQNLPRADGVFAMQKGENPWNYSQRLYKYCRQLCEMHAEDVSLIYGDPITMLKSLIRSTVIAPEGYVIIDADLNAIENRVLGWMASDPLILRVFELNRDPYVDFATYMFGQDYDALFAEYKAGDKTKRTTAKPGVLGCGYMLGAGEERENKKTGEIEATGLLGYAWNMGVKLTHEESQHSVDVFRKTFKEVKNFWYEIEKAALHCVRTGRPVDFRMLRFDIKGPFLRMRLPSGRHLHYYRPRVEPKRTPWGETRDNLTYEGLNTTGQWVRISTHPGKLTENADQAISRDLLAHGMRLAYKEGIDVRAHVHDQILGLAKEDEAEEKLRILQECMGFGPDWASGLPLASAGHICKVFLKD